MEENKYTIEDLSELTGFSRRTVRFYVQEGLLEPPAGRGRGGFYFDSHLNQLRVIKGLQEKGMKLSSIIAYMKGGKAPKIEYAREVWVRHEIVPGLEVNVRRDLEEKEGRMVSEIIRIAKSIAKERKDNES